MICFQEIAQSGIIHPQAQSKLRFVDCNKPFWRKLMYKKDHADKILDRELSDQS